LRWFGIASSRERGASSTLGSHFVTLASTLATGRRHAWRLRHSLVRSRAFAVRLALPALIAAAAVGYHWQLILARRVLADYDVFVYFYPLHAYAARRLSMGELPLWNPHAFMGSPFFANPQTAVLYPLSVLFAVVPVPYAYSLSLVLHLALAGISFFAFARITLGVGPLAALLGGLTFMLSGFFAGQTGHLNQVETAAWLPLLLLVVDRAVSTRSPGYVALSALILTLQLLAGHPQEAYIGLVVIAIFLGSRIFWEGLWATLVAGTVIAGVAALGAGMAAVQLLPTLSLTALGIRGEGVSYADSVAVSLPLSLLPRAILPGFGEQLPNTELIGYVGVIPLSLALLALVVSRSRAVLPLAVAAAVGLFLAIGDTNPLYATLFEIVPGLSSFRVPARWLFAFTFAAAGLAALGLDILERHIAHRRAPSLEPQPQLRNSQVQWGESGLSAFGLRIPLTILGRGAIVGLLIVFGTYWLLRRAAPQPPLLVAEWAALGILTVALAALAARIRHPSVVAAMVVLSAAELWFAASGLPMRYPVPAAVYGDPRASTTFLQTLPSTGRVLSIAREDYVVKEEPEYRVRYASLPDRSVLNFLIATKWNEILMPNVPVQYGIDSVDGYDGGVLPLATFVRLSGVIIPPPYVRPDGVLLSRLATVPMAQHLDLMGVHYVLDTKNRDATVDGIYLDRSIVVRLRPGQSHELTRLPPMEATSFALLSALDGERVPTQGERVGTLTVSAGDATETADLRNGSETAHREPSRIALSAGLKVVHPVDWSADGQPEDYLARVTVPRRQWQRVSIRNTSADLDLVLTSLTVIDDEAQRSNPLVLDDRFDRTLFFDTKVYHYVSALPRAYLAHTSVVLDDDAAIAAMREEGYDPRDGVILAPGPAAVAMERGQVDEQAVEYQLLQPERVRVDVRAKDEGWVVLSDAYTPDWKARVNGVEVPVERANVLFRAVRVGAGNHIVEFTYEPSSLLVGGAISLGAAVATLLVALWTRFLAWPRRGRTRS
jgi:hypothetical protein